MLNKTSSNLTHLIPLNDVVNMMLYFVHPLIANNIHLRMKGNQRSGVVRAQGLNLIAYSIMPCLIHVNIKEYNRFKGRRGHYPKGRSDNGGRNNQILSLAVADE